MAEAEMSGQSLEELAQQKELVQEREDSADHWEEALQVWEEALNKRGESAEERDAAATMRENTIKRREKALQEKIKAMKQRKGVLKEKEEELSNCLNVLKMHNNGVNRVLFALRASAAWSSIHIHQLPDEVLERIFSLLSLQTVTKVVSVCRRWRGLIEDRYLNKKLAFKDPKISTKEARCLIHSAPKLKSLELFRRYDTVALLDAASARCTNLLHLSVQFWKASIPLTKALRKVFEASPYITNLRLIYISASEDLMFYQDLGALLPDLRKLELNIAQLSDLQLDALVDSCSNNQMEEFKVLSNSCSEETIGKLVQFWGRSLQVLELRATYLTDGALVRLGGCSELRQLKLLGLLANVDDLCGLAALSHLEELYVSHTTQIEHEKWCLFFSQSKSCHVLRKLSLIGSYEVDDSVLASVAAFCPQLEELEGNGRNVTISAVRELLRCCHKLHNLDVSCTRANLLILRDLPQLAPQLRRIRIGDAAKHFLGDAVLSQIQALLPHLSLE